ncbi:MAG: class I SAM-dependent methyltransferase, partial [Candidatus Parvarchaeota archaeon]
ECHFTHDHEISSYKNFFDVIFIAGVYHHINPILRNTATQKIHTLIKNGGLAIIFEHNPYNPLTKHMVNTCEFDKDAILLTKKELISLFNSNDFHYVESKYCLFVPLILKKLNFLENLLFKIPLGGQHYSKK